MKDDPELFASDAAPKRRARARRTSVAASAPESAAESGPAAALEDLRATGERFIRDQPLLAVALAVGVGYLIGRLRR